MMSFPSTSSQQEVNERKLFSAYSQLEGVACHWLSLRPVYIALELTPGELN